MPKQVSHEEFDELIKIVETFPQGAGFEEIVKLLKTPPLRRTLQRRLKALIQSGDLCVEGNARARKYRLPIPDTEKKLVKGAFLKLTHTAEEIQSKVTQPIQVRPRVNYHREFLEEYRPNSTFYLSESLRRRLLEMGKTQDGKYPAGTYARQIFHRLLIDLSWNSSRLEGNTYSLLETERLLELGIMAEGKGAKETQMILNHKAAIEFLVDSAKEIGINRYILLNLHALLSDNLLPDSACGSLRLIPVRIGKSVYNPLSISQLINECFERLIATANAIEDPFEQAFFLMVQLPYLQPFEDVNKRTSRLAANIPLIKKNLCPLSFIDVPMQTYINGLLGIYELNRIELLRDVFVWAYERSCFLYTTTRNILGEPDVFRMQYRNIIIQVIAEIVRACMDKVEAVTAIRHRASEFIPMQDQARFVEIVEREIQSLHEGSIARYRLRPSEYEAWRKNWQ